MQVPLLAGAQGQARVPQDRLEHDPEKWIPVFGKDHAKDKELERDDDSKKKSSRSRLATTAGGTDVGKLELV
jgi:hypothetical protein